MNFNNNVFNPTNNPDLNDLYGKIEALKAQKEQVLNPPRKRTVYDDINDTWNGLSSDEQHFIENSDEYKNANMFYQQQFNAFLIERMGDEFLKSKYGTAPEKVLGVIKEKKDEYQKNLSNDISTIKEQNKLLMKQNEELNKIIKRLNEDLLVKK